MESGTEVPVRGTSEKVQDTAAEFRSRGFACHGVAADLSDRESLRTGFARSPELPDGRIDILVNCAGIFLASRASDYLNGAIIPVDGGYASK